MGDININIIQGNKDKDGEPYLNLTAGLGLLPGHTYPTHINNCLDDVMVKTVLNTQIMVLDSVITDHSLILTNVSLNPKRKPNNIFIDKINHDDAIKSIESADFSLISSTSNADTAAEKLVDLLTSAIKKTTVKIKIPRAKRTLKAWMTSGLIRYSVERANYYFSTLGRKLADKILANGTKPANVNTMPWSLNSFVLDSPDELEVETILMGLINDCAIGIIFLILFVSITKAVAKFGMECNLNFDKELCIYNLNCTGNIDPYVADYNNIACSNNIYVNGMQLIPVHIAYREVLQDNNYDEHISIGNDPNNYVTMAIVQLDLSHNQLKLHPTLNYMPHLMLLNISHNNLIVAKLSNNIEFQYLKSVDFSYNMIKLIEVNQAEYAYVELIDVDLSHNLIEEIPESIFSSFSQMQYLNLKNNRLHTLNILCFEGIKNLQRLQLGHNEIVDINSSFLRFKDLQELSLEHNRIERILSRDFQNLFNLNKLYLSNNNISYIEKSSFDKMTYLNTLDLSDNFLFAIDKEVFSNTRYLQYVDLSRNKLKHMSKELFRGKNISFFSIQNNIIEGELVTGMFIGLSDITELDISNQYLTSIEDYAFMGLDNLEILLLNDNKIKSLSNKSFRYLQNVKEINLSNNKLIKINFEKIDLLNLGYLSLRNNLINDIKQEDFNKLTHLQVLDLSNNNISKIESSSFKELQHLEFFNLFNNPLLIFLDSNSFDGLHEIDNKSFLERKSLHHIDLSFNPILLLKLICFSTLNDLRSLNLSGIVSNINFIDMNKTMLTELQLSYARIQNITTLHLSSLKNLEKLVITNNAVSEVDKNAFLNVSCLQYLDLSYNMIKYVQPGAFKTNYGLKFLNVSHNFLVNINYGISHGLINLNILDLSFNQIESLEYDKIMGAVNLNTLIIDNNKISNINIKFPYTPLSKLSIGGNPISCRKILELIQDSDIEITAIRRDVHSENIKGITCNNQYTSIRDTLSTQEETNSVQILNELKTILVNSSISKTYEPLKFDGKNYFANITERIQMYNNDVMKQLSRLNDAALSIDRDNNRTNSLLERLLKVIVAMHTTVKPSLSPLVKDNATFNNIISHIHQIKQELQSDLVVQKESIMSEIDSKISLAMATKEPIKEKLSNTEGSLATQNKFNFIEICVSLTLIIIIVLLLFIAYKKFNRSCTSWRSTSFSRQHIAESLENSNL
ncbi:unnamed protein product [Parnassius mnemosyne]|uniref:Chaoptin n=1 Tax=Parnassius mnemosyne TaxID=213953 RepID=A0AAV1KSK1_9NEOP